MRTHALFSKKKEDRGTRRQRNKRMPGNFINFLAQKKGKKDEEMNVRFKKRGGKNGN